jgi:Putative Ig domain
VLAQQCTTYPYPHLNAQIPTYVTEDVTVSGCSNSSLNSHTFTAFATTEFSYPPPDIAPANTVYGYYLNDIPSNFYNFNTVCNGQSQFQGQFSDPYNATQNVNGYTITYNDSYDISVSGSTITETFTPNVFATNGTTVQTDVRPKTSIFNIQTGDQIYTFGPLHIDVVEKESGGCIGHSVVTEQGSASLNQYIGGLQITSSQLMTGKPGVAYQQGNTALGGTQPYSWSWTATAGSTLPPGLSIDRSSGLISGTPGQSGTFQVTITVNDSAGLSASKQFPLVVGSSCQLNSNDLKAQTSQPYSNDLHPVVMTATFSPTDSSGKPVALADLAGKCGYTNFDWQQTITTLPSPSPFYAELSSPGCSGPQNNCVSPPSIIDPPLGGYVYERSLNVNGNLVYPNGDNAFPLYLDADPLSGELLASEKGGYVLTFQDTPMDYCLLSSLGVPSTAYVADPTICGGSTAPLGATNAYTTHLVGLCGTAPGCKSTFVPGTTTNCITDQTCVDLGIGFNWTSNFNGDNSTDASSGSGGVELIATTKNTFLLPDPGSGTGGVTITSINGVPQTPSSATCAATPTVLWPPNGRSIPVTITGTIAAGTSALVSTTYFVVDSYGQVQPTGVIALASNGSYTFSIPLVASRHGTDINGRTYTIYVSGQDTIGNVGFCSAVVTVPHDQGNN